MRKVPTIGKITWDFPNKHCIGCQHYEEGTLLKKSVCYIFRTDKTSFIDGDYIRCNYYEPNEPSFKSQNDR